MNNFLVHVAMEAMLWGMVSLIVVAWLDDTRKISDKRWYYLPFGLFGIVLLTVSYRLWSW